MLLLACCSTRQVTEPIYPIDEGIVYLYEGTLAEAIPENNLWLLYYDIPNYSIVQVYIQDSLYAGDDWFELESGDWFFRYNELWGDGSLKAKGYVAIYQNVYLTRESKYLIIIIR